MRLTIKTKGFTLVELAIVLAIVGLLIAGMLLPLSVQRDLRDYEETRIELSEIREALIGYALSQTPPYLPCPDTDATPDGLENREGTGACTSSRGVIPWATLGVGEVDSWNNNYIYSATDAFTNSGGFSLASTGTNTILDSAGGNNVAVSVPTVIVSIGKNRQGAGGSADEQENSNAGQVFVSHSQIDVAANAFDDIVVWVPATILFNRMVTAGKLP